ncbi:protein ytfM precursor [Vibrio ishigakensis]|uniref:Protein ytfM n=1 Tax=Vibrio ishigakensis TaxID=1481914 RepID=A0A0B8Q3A4_9VIBR|nr:protein ytfM precursor [Vibrio ishigakensis]
MNACAHLSKTIIAKLLSGLLMLSSNSVLSAEFVIVGVPKNLEQNLQAHLAPLENVAVTDIKSSQVQALINSAMMPFGYYHSASKITAKSTSKLTLEITKGERVRIAHTDIVISGSATKDPEFNKLIKQRSLAEGEGLDHQAYEDFKSRLHNLSNQRGYLDAKITKSRLEVAPSDNSANVIIHFDSGPRYKFGQVSFINSPIDDKRMHSLETFKKGSYLDSNKLGEFHSKLLETNWFKGAVITPRQDQANSDLEVPIEVIVEPKAKKIVEVGGGYATDIGLRASLNWSQPWYNSHGHSFGAKVKLSKPEQALSLGYTIPTENVLDEYYGVQFETTHVDYRDTQSLANNLTFERHWKLGEEWQTTVYLRYLNEKYQQASDEDHSKLLMPGIAFSMLEQSEHWHDIEQKHFYSLEYSDTQLFSDAQILRLRGNTAFSWSITDSQKFHFRSNIGMNITDSLSEVPSSLRFFAGGDGSVRGYGYEAISPKNEAGELTGGRYLFTAGFEYQYRILEPFGWVHFSMLVTPSIKSSMPSAVQG